MRGSVDELVENGLVMLTYGVLLMVGAAGGNTDPLQPLKGVGGGVAAHEEERFRCERRHRSQAALSSSAK